MAYEKFKTVLSKEQYFESFNATQLGQMIEKQKDEKYNYYLTKCEVLKRDNYKCQNKSCKYPDAGLEMHHVKTQRRLRKETPNNQPVQHKARDCVSVCEVCHSKYELAEDALTFDKDAINIPPHIRGHTFRLPEPIKKFDWKGWRIQMRKFRRELILSGFKPPKLRDIELLMKFLTVPYYEFDLYFEE